MGMNFDSIIDSKYMEYMIFFGKKTKYGAFAESFFELVGIIFPKDDVDPWELIKERVEALVDEKIELAEKQRLQEEIKGLKGLIDDFNKDRTLQEFETIRLIFKQKIPSFKPNPIDGNGQPNGIKKKLLRVPYYVQFLNVYLSLLSTNISEEGATQKQISRISDDLKEIIPESRKYLDELINEGIQHIKQTVPFNAHDISPFKEVNTFIRDMTITVYYYTDLWPFYHPELAKDYKVPVREIYTDPCGSTDDIPNGFQLPSIRTSPIGGVRVWAGDRVNTVQIGYATDNGIELTPVMGMPATSLPMPPYGAQFKVDKENPIEKVKIKAGHVIESCSFIFKNASEKIFGKGMGGEEYEFSFKDHILSSVYIPGISNFYQCAPTIIFGFKYDKKDNTK